MPIHLLLMYLTYINCLCFSRFFWGGGCMLLASCKLSDSTVEKRLLCSEGFCVLVKKPLHFQYVQHGSTQNEHAESWLKFTDLQNSLSSPPSSPYPLGLEVMAVCNKRAHSFVNVRFSIHPAFWKSPYLHEYFISGGEKYVPRYKLHQAPAPLPLPLPYATLHHLSANFGQYTNPSNMSPRGFTHTALILLQLIVLHEPPHTFPSCGTLPKRRCHCWS